jgi:hypothetical protein
MSKNVTRAVGVGSKSLNKMISALNGYINDTKNKTINLAQRYDKLKKLCGQLSSIAEQNSNMQLSLKFKAEADELGKMKRAEFAIADHDSVIGNINTHLGIKK